MLTNSTTHGIENEEHAKCPNIMSSPMTKSWKLVEKKENKPQARSHLNLAISL